MNILNTKSRLKTAIDLLNKEIEKHYKNEPAEGHLEQLVRFRDCFLDALNKVENNTLPPPSNRQLGIAHTVVDSWSIKSKLGEFLINAEHAYKMCKKETFEIVNSEKKEMGL